MEICLRGKRLITRNNYLTVCWFECVTRGQSSLSCNRSFKIQTYQKCNSKEFISIKERKKNLFFISGAFAVSALTGVYATGRSIQTLVDRRQHQQNIGLRSSESRSCWLGIAGNVIGIASGGATVAAGSSAAMAMAEQIVLKSVKTGSFAMGGTNFLTNKIRKLSTRRKFAAHLTDIYNCENNQSEKEKLHEKMWGIVNDFIILEVFHKKDRISGIPNDHFFQGIFEIFKGNEKYGFTLLKFETTNTSAQDAAQISFDVKRIRSNPFDKMLGQSCNGMQSEEQHYEMAAELTGSTDSICMPECDDTAIIKVNDSADVIMM